MPGDSNSFVQNETLTSDHRRNNIDFIRFVLATLVIWSHSFPLASGTEEMEPFRRFTHGQMTFGGLAVAGFFTISGYLITASWVRSRNFNQYLWKRVLRIHPGFAVAMAFSFFVAAPFAGVAWEDLFKPRHFIGAGVGNLILLHEYQEKTAFLGNPFPSIVNGSLWTIHHEFICYLLVPLIAAAARLRRIGPLLLVGGGLLLCVNFSFGLIVTQASNLLILLIGGEEGWYMTLPYFLAGAAAYFLRSALPMKPAAFAIALSIMLCGAYVPHGLALAGPTAGAFALLWISLNPRFRLPNLSRYGDFSYGIYLYAFPIQQLMVQRLQPISPLTLFCGSWPLALAAGVFSWYCVERPFLTLKPRHARPRDLEIMPAQLQSTIAKADITSAPA